MRNLGVTTRLVIMFVFLSVLPLVGALILLHDRGAADAEVFLACMAALSIVMLGPLAEGAAQWLVLRDVRDINRACLDVRRAVEKGLRLSLLNIGNLHYAKGKRQLSPSVALGADDESCLRFLMGQGVELDFRCVPNDPVQVRFS